MNKWQKSTTWSIANLFLAALPCIYSRLIPRLELVTSSRTAATPTVALRLPFTYWEQVTKKKTRFNTPVGTHGIPVKIY
jgi:hypothetical protein